MPSPDILKQALITLEAPAADIPEAHQRHTDRVLLSVSGRWLCGDLTWRIHTISGMQVMRRITDAEMLHRLLHAIHTEVAE